MDYLFFQVGVDRPTVTDRQNCGNLLAGVGPFAVERGLVAAGKELTSVRIRMVNSGDHATANFPTAGGRVVYSGTTEISGVPGAAAPVAIGFGRGSAPLLPTGRALDIAAGTPVTCVDNGMPTVLIAASALQVTGYEAPGDLEENVTLKERLRRIRLAAGKLMGLGDVSGTTVPKLTLLAPPAQGGTVTTRTFIPVRCHTAIGVLGAASVAAGLRMAGGVGEGVARLPDRADDPLRIEHPTGFLDVESVVDTDAPTPVAQRTAVVRTARKIFDGTVFPRPAVPPAASPAVPPADRSR